MSNLLYVTNIGGKNMAYGFSGSAIEAAHSLGIDFFSVANRSQATHNDIAVDEKKYNVKLLHSDIARSPFNFCQNYKAYKQLVEFIKQEKIDYIHCNTPTGGILGRLAGKKCKVKKVIYQAHGFHFYKGAPKKNRLVYYPVEKWLAKYTDALITINKEDFELASKKFRLRNNGKVYYVAGVGIDTNQYLSDGKLRDEKRAELNIPLDAFVVISVGELNENKNNKVIISALEKLKNKNIHYILCGVGDKKEALKEMAESSGVSENVHFLGYRTDIKALYNASDCFVMPSYREGLSRSAMEAMASGLPCILSDIRGNRDLIENGSGGFLCKPDDVIGFSEAMLKLYGDCLLCEKMKEYNLKKIKDFDTSVVEKEIREIYINELIRG